MHTGEETFTFDQCQDCEAVFLNPRPSLTELADYYKAYYLPYRGASAWGKFASLVARDQANVDAKRQATLERYTTLDKSTVLLDIGCGKPSFLKHVSAKYQNPCIGTDFSDHGWSADPEVCKGLTLHVGEPLSVRLPRRADIVTMWHYLEHDYHPYQTLTGLKSMCHAATRLIIEVPDHNASSRHQYKENWSAYHTPRHMGLYTVDSMTTLLERSGWKVVHAYRKGTLDPYTLIWMSRMEQEGIDWSASMEPRFWNYVRGMLSYWPHKLIHGEDGQGFLTVVAALA